MRQFEKYQVQEIQVQYNGPIPNAPYTIRRSQDVAEMLQCCWNQHTLGVQESFGVLLLNNAHQVKGFYELSKGGITATMLDIRLLFAVVLKSLSTAIILAHCHPSGALKASAADKEVTRRVQEAAKFLDIMVLDHIIITPFDTYYSFADEGLI